MALLWNGVVAVGSWCLTCSGAFGRARASGTAMLLLGLLYIGGYLGICWGTLTLFRGAAGRVPLIEAGLKTNLVAGGCWLLVSAVWIVTAWWDGNGWRLAWQDLIVAIPPLAILAMNGFLLVVLRPILARRAASEATADS